MSFLLNFRNPSRKVIMANLSKVFVIGINKERQGGVASVFKILEQAGFFSEDKGIYYLYSSNEKHRLSRALSAITQYFYFIYSVMLRRPAILHIHFSADYSFWRKVPYILFGKLSGCKLLLHIHPVLFWDYYQGRAHFIRRIIFHILNQADGFIVTNKYLCEQLCGEFQGRPVHLIENPLNVSYFANPLHLHRKKQVLFLGAILPGKGVYDLVQAMPLVLRSCPDCRFLFAGNQENERLKKELHKLRLHEQSDVLDWVDMEQKRILLQTSEMFILPSYSEGLPMAVLEAMASALPVISTAAGGLAQLLIHEENALIIPAGNPLELANAIIRLHGDQALQQKIAQQALLAVQRFDVNRVMQKTFELYQQFLR
jgi:glycosyltransferase involved in cell wall biosynthesis